MLWGNTAYCAKLSGEDLSRCSNNIEPIGLRRRPFYYESDVTVTELAPHHGGKTAGIDMV